MRSNRQPEHRPSPELVAHVRGKLAAGLYANDDEVIRDCLRDIEEGDPELEHWLRTEVAAEIDLMRADPSRGLTAAEVRETLAAKRRNRS